MFIVFIPAAIYICLSLIFPMRMSWWLKLIFSILFILGACRAQWLNLFWASHEPILPEAPRSIMIVASTLYTAVLVFSQLTLLRDLLFLPRALFLRFIRKKAWSFPYQQSGIVVLAIGLLATSFTMWQSMRLPQTREVEIRLPSLPIENKQLRIAFLADIHLSAINDASYAQGIVERVNALHPDLIVIVGDICDGAIRDRKNDLAPLGDLKAPLGVYVSAGNHEYYSGYQDCMQAYRELGFKTLENENAEPITGLSLIGVGDYAGYTNNHPHYQTLPGVDLLEAMKGLPEGNATILLGHQPCIAAIENLERIDLLLSGHSHGGMMPGPLSWFTNYASSGYPKGAYQVGNTSLYVTTGAGTWPGAMFRFHVPSEILLLNLTATQQTAQDKP